MPTNLASEIVDHPKTSEAEATRRGSPIGSWRGITNLFSRLGLPPILFVSLIIPSANHHIFNGVPLSALPEFLFLLLLAPFLLSRFVRRCLRNSLFRGHPQVFRLVFALAGFVLASKVILLVSDSYQGFLGCYRSTLSVPPRGQCEKSYENPFGRFGVTRIDRELRFGPRDWNLSFVNSLRFNFDPLLRGNPLRERLPFTADWTATLDSPRSETLRITYVGRGLMDLDGTRIALPDSGKRLHTLTVRVAPGLRRFRLRYLFDEAYRAGDPGEPGPYASLFVEHAATRNPHRWDPLIPRPPAIPYRLLGRAVDCSFFLFAIVLVRSIGPLLLHEWKIVAGALIAALLVRKNPLLVDGFGLEIGFIAATGWLFWVLARRKRLHALLIGYLVLIFWTFQRPAVAPLPVHEVQYRSAGNDWLTYESFARSILETGSLQAGEDVFYQQPLSRYLNFLLHVTFGDGDTLITIAALAALNLALLFAFVELLAPVDRRRWRVWQTACIFLLLLLANSSVVVTFVTVGASEYPTWVVLPLLFAFFFGSRLSAGRAMAGSLLLGLSIATRPNQAPALIAIFLVFCIFRQIPPRLWTACAALVVLAGCLPLAHNLFFGRRFVLFTTTASHPAALALPPKLLPRAFSSAEVWSVLRRQLGGLLVLGRLPGPVAGVFHALQFVWLASVVWALTHWSRRSRVALSLAIVPLLYLGAHVFYDVETYFPRHIMAGYVSIGLVGLAALGAVVTGFQFNSHAIRGQSIHIQK